MSNNNEYVMSVDYAAFGKRTETVIMLIKVVQSPGGTILNYKVLNSWIIDLQKSAEALRLKINSLHKEAERRYNTEIKIEK